MSCLVSQSKKKGKKAARKRTTKKEIDKVIITPAENVGKWLLFVVCLMNE